MIRILFALLFIICGPSMAADCRWDHPAANAYTGTVREALARYKTMPAEVRAELLRKVDAKQYDDQPTMHADGSITGAYAYSNARDMHFGAGKVCIGPVKWAWAEGKTERALAYTSGRWTILYMAACRNVTLVDRGDRVDKLAAEKAAVTPVAGGSPASLPTIVLQEPNRDPATGAEVPNWPPGGWREVVTSPPPIISITHHVPEPATWMLVAVGILVLSVVKRVKLKVQK